MKRFLFIGLSVIAATHAAFGYINQAVVQVPPMDPKLIQIDAGNTGHKFVNQPGAFFGVSFDVTPYRVSNVLNYTNRGLMVGVPGFDFQYFPFPAPAPQPGVPFNTMAANFVNEANGLNNGVIDCSGILSGGVLTAGNPLFFLLGQNASLAGRCIISATNIVNSGQINMDASALIKLTGKTIDLTRGSLTMASPSQLFFIDANGVLTTFGIGNAGILDGYWGVGQNTTNNLLAPFRYNFFPPTSSPFNPVTTRTFAAGFAQLFLPNAQGYVSDTFTDQSNRFVQVVFLNNTDPAISNSVFFVPGSETAVQWQWQVVDYITGAVSTNYLYLTDNFGEVTNLQLFANGFAGSRQTFIPANYAFFQGSPYSLSASTPPSTAPLGVFDNVVVSNQWSAYQAIFSPSAQNIGSGQLLGDVAGQNVTNMAGRIEITAADTLDLTETRMTALGYLLLEATNHFKGYDHALLLAPNLDLYLRSTNGVLSSTNLVVPNLPSPSGTCGLDSERWIEVTTNIDATGTNTITVTNHFHILFVDSQITPLSPAFVQTLSLKATNAATPGVDQIVISDILNVTSNLFIDTRALTLTTNGPGAFTPAGQLNLLSSDIFWSPATPRLRYLTNSGVISSQNLINFAGNMTSPDDERAGAIPYEALVNHGSIINQGVFILANYFENSGVIQENSFGSIDVQTFTAIATNGSFISPNGNVSIAANSLIASNGFITAGGSLTLTVPCSLSDGYVFGNQFSHIATTNSPGNIVTNGNTWVTSGGIRIPIKPPVADLLGTTVINNAQNNLNSINQWAGTNRGCSVLGFADNLALGRMILDGHTNSLFTFVSTTGNNALYVDYLEFRDGTTVTTTNGDFPQINIQPGMKIYYAQALMNGVSIAEKLNGKNGGGFCWVSNYAGVYSSTNLTYSDGNTYIFNQALVISPNIDSDGDTIVNRNDVEPISTNSFFDIVVTGPNVCGGGSGSNSGTDNGNADNTNSNNAIGTLSFPVKSSGSGSGSVSFAIAQGSYNGLFYETNGVKPSSSGYFSAKLTSKGGFTARVQIGSGIYSFSGQIDSSGHWSNNSISGKSLPPLKAELQIADNNQIVGEMSGQGWSAQLLADRAAFSSKNPTRWAGKKTVLFPANEESSTTAVGDGFGTVTISSSGGVQWSGTLADGTAVSQKSALSKDGVWPLYASLYGGSGSFIGWMQFTNRSGSDIEGSALWIMPAGNRAVYPNGLTNQLDAIGSRISGSLGFSKGKTVLSGGNLDSSLTNSVNIFGNTVQSSNSSLKLSVNPQTGLFSGSVVDSSSGQNLSFRGALLEKSGIGAGFFMDVDQSGKIYLGPVD